MRKLIEELNLKKLVTNKNIRNLKDKVKIEKLSINFYDKMLLMKLICVEHMINKFKKFKRIHLRYDRLTTVIFMASLLIIIKNTGL